MKKILIAFFMVNFLFSFEGFAMGYDEGYQIGSQLGSSIGSAVGAAAKQRAWRKGDVSRKTNVNNNYDFSKLKSFIVLVKSNGTYPNIQQDNNFVNLHVDTLINHLTNKYFVFDGLKILAKVTQTYPELDRNSKIFIDKLNNELSQFDAWLTVNIYSFNTTNEGYTNVSYDITVNPLKSNEQVFSYKESRFNVPYKSGYELFDDICNKFEPQFNKYFKNSMKGNFRS